MQDHFRAWDAKSRTMYGYDWDYLFIPDGSFVVLDEKDVVAHSKTNNLTLIRCTGWKSRKGKYVFEGDIVEDPFGVIFEVSFGEYPVNSPDEDGYVTLAHGWHLKNPDTCESFVQSIAPGSKVFATAAADCIIVGNIFENSLENLIK